MKTSQSGINLIKFFEGFRKQTYLDSVGVKTIGYGHTKGVKLGMVITETKGEQLLSEDLAYFEKRVLELVKIPLRQNEFDALVSFTFNVGEGNLKKSTLLKRLNKLVYANNAMLKEVSKEFLKWDKAGGKVLAGLTKRREAERELFLRAIKINEYIEEIGRLAIPKPLEDIKDPLISPPCKKLVD